jgi:putative iron-dependent peroxidase
VKPTCSHSSLTTIEENGVEVKILRDNMPFGRPTQGEFGTYFIGYSKSPGTIELMLQNMFIGRPPGNYDRLLDFSRAVTGNLFFVPAASFLEDVSDEQAAAIAAPSNAPANASSHAPSGTPGDSPSSSPSTDETGQAAAPSKDGSLDIGSLKGEMGHE